MAAGVGDKKLEKIHIEGVGDKKLDANVITPYIYIYIYIVQI